MQTNYDINRSRAFTGLGADSRIPTEVVTASAGETLNWGDAVYVSDWSEAEDKIVVKKLEAGQTNISGFVYFEHRQQNDSSQTISLNQDVPILRKGAIYVDNTAGTVTAGNNVVVDATSRKLQSSSGSGDKEHHGIQFLSGAAEGKLVKIQANLPSYIETK